MWGPTAKCEAEFRDLWLLEWHGVPSTHFLERPVPPYPGARPNRSPPRATAVTEDLDVPSGADSPVESDPRIVVDLSLECLSGTHGAFQLVRRSADVGLQELEHVFGVGLQPVGTRDGRRRNSPIRHDDAVLVVPLGQLLAVMREGGGRHVERIEDPLLDEVGEAPPRFTCASWTYAPGLACWFSTRRYVRM